MEAAIGEDEKGKRESSGSRQHNEQELARPK